MGSIMLDYHKLYSLQDEVLKIVFEVENIKQALLKRFDLKISIEAKDFTRYIANNLLQIDFINDIDSRYKDVIVTKDGFIIDNVENILSNKLTAVLGRDNPKDIFDIYLIWKFYDFSWRDILKSAHQKAEFSDEELIVRLKSFPKALLDDINIIDTNFLKDFDSDFPKLIQEISIS